MKKLKRKKIKTREKNRKNKSIQILQITYLQYVTNTCRVSNTKIKTTKQILKENGKIEQSRIYWFASVSSEAFLAIIYIIF